MIKLYVQSIAKYHKGIAGKWLELPMEQEKLEKEIQNILGDTEEYFITDYDSPFDISEFANVFELNETIQEIQDLNIDKEGFTALCKCHTSCDYKEVLGDILEKNFTLVDVTKNTFQDEADIAFTLYEEDLLLWLHEIPENLIDFIDWESVWRNCNITYGWQKVFFEDTGNQYAVNIG